MSPIKPARLIIKTFVTLSLLFLLSGFGPAGAENNPAGPETAPETVEKTAPATPGKGIAKKSGSSPKQQIKEGGREIGKGFKDLGLGIGRGFKNMGQSLQKAWTGEK
jgi:hypothetical protein